MFPWSPGAEGGGVKRSIGEIVDEDAPAIPKKKKYAKEAWPGINLDSWICAVKQTWYKFYRFGSCKPWYWLVMGFPFFPGRKPGPAQGLFWGVESDFRLFCTSAVHSCNVFVKRCIWDLSWKMNCSLKRRHVNLRSILDLRVEKSITSIVLCVSSRELATSFWWGNWYSQFESLNCPFYIVVYHCVPLPLHAVVTFGRIPSFRFSWFWVEMTSCAPFGLHAGATGSCQQMLLILMFVILFSVMMVKTGKW